MELSKVYTAVINLWQKAQPWQTDNRIFAFWFKMTTGSSFKCTTLFMPPSSPYCESPASARCLGWRNCAILWQSQNLLFLWANHMAQIICYIKRLGNKAGRWSWPRYLYGCRGCKVSDWWDQPRNEESASHIPDSVFLPFSFKRFASAFFPFTSFPAYRNTTWILLTKRTGSMCSAKKKKTIWLNWNRLSFRYWTGCGYCIGIYQFFNYLSFRHRSKKSSNEGRHCANCLPKGENNLAVPSGTQQSLSGVSNLYLFLTYSVEQKSGNRR